MSNPKDNGSVHSDAGQGDGEEQTESYSKYEEGAPELSTKSGTENIVSDDSSTVVQDDKVQVSIEEAIQFAKKYCEDLLSFFGLNTDVYATTEDNEVIELHIPSTHLNGFLIGQHGDTIRSIQYLISTALKSANFAQTRVNVDVADYKKQRADRLASQAEVWFKQVQESGEAKELSPMNSADRRVVHKAANDFGIETESIGEGRDRRVVLKPAVPESKKPSAKSPKLPKQTKE